MKRNKISTRILKSYILLTSLLLLCILGVLTVFSNYYVHQQSIASQKIRMTNVSQSIDMQINTAYEITNSLYWSDDIHTLALEGSKAVTETDICHAVKTRADSALANNISVYVSALSDSSDLVYGPERAVSSMSFLKSAGFGSVSAMGIRNYFVQNPTDTYFRLMEKGHGEDGNILAIVERKMYQDKPIYFFILLDLNSFIYVESSDDTVMIMANNLVLACSNYKIAEPQNGIYTLLEKNGNINAVIGKSQLENGYQYYVTKSNVADWYYILATPYNLLSPTRVNMYLLSLACVLGIALLALACMFVLRRYVYAPIARTVKTVGQYTAAHCEDEESYICATLDECAAVSKRLEQENAKHRQNTNMNMLKDMLRGIRPDNDALNVLVRDVCVEQDGPYRVCILEFSKYAQLEDAFSEEMICEIREQVLEFVRQQVDDGLVAEPLVMDYRRFVVISSGVDIRSLRAKLMNVVAAVSASFEMELIGAVGDLCEHLRDVDTSYVSALKILDSHYSLGSRNAIVTGEDMAAGISEISYYPLETERELIAEVIRCHENAVAEILTRILEENFEKHPFTKERLNAFAFSVASTVNRIADAIGKSTEEIFGRDNLIFPDLKMCTDKMEVQGKVYGLFNVLVEFISNETPNGEQDVSVQMLAYIHEHYNEDISLSDLSKAFSLSMSYTSTLFKEVTGENFKDYLNRYRIKRACDILREEPNIKNAQLAQRVGCNTVATLLRLFNKYEGTTPGQFGKTEE